MSYIDTHSIFQGNYEYMIQFYNRGVSFVAKYISTASINKLLKSCDCVLCCVFNFVFSDGIRTLSQE